jgi:hypothetical protein
VGEGGEEGLGAGQEADVAMDEDDEAVSGDAPPSPSRKRYAAAAGTSGAAGQAVGPVNETSTAASKRVRFDVPAGEGRERTLGLASSDPHLAALLRRRAPQSAGHVGGAPDSAGTLPSMPSGGSPAGAPHERRGFQHYSLDDVRADSEESNAEALSQLLGVLGSRAGDAQLARNAAQPRSSASSSGRPGRLMAEHVVGAAPMRGTGEGRPTAGLGARRARPAVALSHLDGDDDGGAEEMDTEYSGQGSGTAGGCRGGGGVRRFRGQHRAP